IAGLQNVNVNYAVAAGNNWWGSASGPKHVSNPGGTGNVVSNHVVFSPWLGEAPFALPAPLIVWPPPPAFTQVGGAIATNATWTRASSPYLVTADVVIKPNVGLTIEPGVIVKFVGNRKLTVEGMLLANGTAQQHIIFTSAKDDAAGGDSNGDGAASSPAPGDWSFIQFSDSSTDGLTSITFAEIRYGGAGTTAAAVAIDNAAPVIADNLITRSAGFGLLVRTLAAPVIQNNWVIDNLGGGIKFTTSAAGTVLQNRFWGNGSFAMDLDNSSRPLLSGNEAHFNDYNGIKVTGTLASVQQWQANLPYIVVSTRTVDQGATLTVAPGTVVKFKDSTGQLRVRGTLVADGA
ncbi:MAG: right-handed parallel beta-helix repeat-containing protein, partial [Caldilineaceae bacterium]